MFPNWKAHRTGWGCASENTMVTSLGLSVRRQQGRWWLPGDACPVRGAADPPPGVPSLSRVCNQLFSHPSQRPQGSVSHTSPLSLLFSIRWQQTSKSSGLSSSLQPAGAKADALREEMEEAANRVEICRVPPLCSSLLRQTGEPSGSPFCSREFY